MRKELDEALCRDFPLLYKQREAPIHQSCFAWGFQCGDGWEPLIRWLSERLEPLIALQPEDERASASQVKEKYGTLTFDMDGVVTEEMGDLLNTVVWESEYTCEVCGFAGTLRRGGWLSVLCDVHAKDDGYPTA